MEILDATVITTALPVIAADFIVPAAHIYWCIGILSSRNTFYSIKWLRRR